MKRQVPVNMLLNVVNFLVGLLAGLWLTPYLMRTLGPSAYGLIPLSMVFAEYIALITTSINGAVARYLTIAIQQDHWEEANRIYATAFWALIMLAALLLPGLAAVSFNLQQIIHVPLAILRDAQLLNLYTFIGFLCSIVSALFSSALYADNRIDLCRVLDIVRVVLRLLVVVLLFSLNGPHLVYMGYANLAGGIGSLAIGAILARYHQPRLRIAPMYFVPTQLRALASFGGWTMVAQLGYTLFARLDLLFANRYVGPLLAGHYAALLQWNSLLQNVAGLLAGVCAPVIMILYSRGHITRMETVTQLVIKLMAMVVAVPAGLLCGFAAPVLRLWLGEAYMPYAHLFWFTLAPLVITLAVAPLYTVQLAYQRVIVPSLVMVAMGLINIPIVMFLAAKTSLGLYGICLSGALIWMLKCGLFNTIYNAYILRRPWHVYITPLLPGVLLFCMVWGTAMLYQYWHPVGNASSLLGAGLLVLIPALPITYFLLLSRQDRREILAMLTAQRTQPRDSAKDTQYAHS